MYQTVINEKSVLKVDLQVQDRKMQRKEEKIAQLEKALSISRDKVIFMMLDLVFLIDIIIAKNNNGAQKRVHKSPTVDVTELTRIRE